MITPDFNYTDQGVTFLTPYPELRIGTPPQEGGFDLFATAGDTADRNWIIADFVMPAWAVGITLPGGTTLSAFDAEEQLIASLSGGGPGGGNFLGIVSAVPIVTATGDRGASFEIWESFLFTPIPEPATLLLLAGGAAVLLRRRRRCISPGSQGVALLVALLVPTGAYGQASQTYTTTDDFNAGFLNNAEGAPDESDGELRIRTPPQTLPYIWVACTERYTVVRIATSTFDPLTQQTVVPGQVLGEYWAAPEGCRDTSAGGQPGPSRTTVDFDGSVWVGNRNVVLVESVSKGHVVKFGSGLAFQWIDRNDNGFIETSAGLDNVLPWPDDGDGVCTPADVANAQDELILLYETVPATVVRHVSVDRRNDVWIGGTGIRLLGLLDGRTGEVIDYFGSFTYCPPEGQCVDVGGYGGLVDRNGVLWSAWGEGGSYLMRYDPLDFFDPLKVVPALHSYGLAVDLDGEIWNTRYVAREVLEIDPITLAAMGYDTGLDTALPRGVAVSPVPPEAENHVWIANSGSRSVTRLDNDLNDPMVIPLVFDDGQVVHEGVEPTGVAVDYSGMVWVTNRGSAEAYPPIPGDVMVIDPNAGDHGEVVNRVDLGSAETHSSGLDPGPYNYSDMTGLSLMWTTAPAGVWAVVFDSQVSGTPWGTITWDADLGDPDNTIMVQARASDVETDLGKETYVNVAGGEAFTCARYLDPAVEDGMVRGRYIQIRVQLNARSHDSTPWSALNWLTVEAIPEPEDCNGNTIPDECEMLEELCTPDAENYPGCLDCNANGIPDDCDILEMTICDLDANGIPDECVACCLAGACANRSPGACAADQGTSGSRLCETNSCNLGACCDGAVCDDNSGAYLLGIECEGVGEFFVPWALCGSSPCQTGVCCSATECVPDALPGDCQIGYVYVGGAECEDNPCAEPPTTEDCNENGVPDECDILLGTSQDANQNGIPDECECPAPDAPEAPPSEGLLAGEGYAKNRYISFVPANPGQMTAIRVTLTEFVNDDPEGPIGSQWWVGNPQKFCENSGVIKPPCPEVPGLPDTFMGAALQCSPYYKDYVNWRGVCEQGECVGGLKDDEPCDTNEDCLGVLHVYGQATVPSDWEGACAPAGSLVPTTYEIQVVEEGCYVEVESNFSVPLEVTMSHWGDIVGDVHIPEGWTQPDGCISILNDVTAALDKFRNIGPPDLPYPAVIMVRADLDLETPNQLIDISDATCVMDAFRGFPYRYGEPQACLEGGGGGGGGDPPPSGD